MVALSDFSRLTFGSSYIHSTCTTDEMKCAGADGLSRYPMRNIFGIKVKRVSKTLFKEFLAFFKTGTTTNFYFDLVYSRVGHRVNRDMISLTAAFATLAKQSKTNKSRIRNAADTKTLALRLNIFDFLPGAQITQADASLAVIATEYAASHFYAPATIAEKTWGFSPFITADLKNPLQYPMTKLVLKGIKSMRSIEKPVGVVLGKDVLHIFNSSLRPEKFYEDLLFVTFD